MTRPTQGLLMALVGAIMLRLGLSDAYLRYVTDWMKWPLVVTGAFLVCLALGMIVAAWEDSPDDVRADHPEPPDHPDRAHPPGLAADEAASVHGHDAHGVPLVTWLLVLPVVVTFVISPPELGSYLAERRGGETQNIAAPAVVSDLDSNSVARLRISEFIWRAQSGDTLEDQPIELTGFVSHGDDGEWYVSRLAIGCCAADAMAYLVEVAGSDRPSRDTWVKVTGTFLSGSAHDLKVPPTITASSVEEIEEPKRTYEY